MENKSLSQGQYRNGNCSTPIRRNQQIGIATSAAKQMGHGNIHAQHGSHKAIFARRRDISQNKNRTSDTGREQDGQ